MKVLNLQQGSPEWVAARTKYFTASEAPAMLGLSKYTTRNDLLRQKATGIAKDIDANTQRLFDAGHEAEEAARPIAESIIGYTLYPVTGTAEIDGLPLLASFDGLTLMEDDAWENKLWNTEFAAYVLNTNDAPDTHWPQLEQQLLVSGARRVLFTVCDGTEDNLVVLWYESKPERRARLIAAWKQFAEDLKNYQHVEIIPAAVAAPQMQLPAVSVQVIGSIEVRDNLTAFGDALSAYVKRINLKPETDQDFADLEATVKTLEKAEAALDSAENGALAQAESIDKMRKLVAESRELARTTRLTIEKLVDAEKKNRREKIVSDAKEALRKFVAELNSRVKFMPEIPADFAGVIKGKKTLASIKGAANDELARAKTDASMTADMIDANLKVYGELAVGYESLFADLGKIVNQPPEACRAIIEQRIAKQKAQEAARRAAEEERIRAEERAKVEREQAEQRRISGLWNDALNAIIEDEKDRLREEEQRQAGLMAAEAIKQDAAAPVEHVATTPALSEVLHSAAPAAVANAIAPSAWQKARDEVAAMLEDMTVAELSLARIALAKIRNERTQRAA